MNDYKIAVIPSSGNDVIYEYGIGEDKHGDVLRKFGVKTYGKDSIFGFFDDSYACTLTQYYLETYGNIIFYNLSYDEDNKFGILCVLDSISSAQKEKVFDFLCTLKDYTVELDSYLTIGGFLTLNDPFEDDYSNGFEEIKEYFSLIVYDDKVRSKKYE